MSSPPPGSGYLPGPDLFPRPGRPPENDAERAVLPDQTGDDLDVGWGERFDDAPDDERFLRERPPHWG